MKPPLMHEPGKVKEDLENKIGITIYSLTLWLPKQKNMCKCLFTLQIESKQKVQRAHNRKNDVSN